VMRVMAKKVPKKVFTKKYAPPKVEITYQPC